MEEKKFIEAMAVVREALDSLYEAALVYDPNADYSAEQVLILATQILGEAAPSIEAAMEALDGLGET